MPYSGPDDESLPANVKQMPAAVRGRWVNVFNDSYSRCRSDSGEDCEAFAFRNANGVVRKRTMAEAAAVLSGRELDLDVSDVHIEAAMHGDHKVKCPECGHAFRVMDSND